MRHDLHARIHEARKEWAYAQGLATGLEASADLAHFHHAHDAHQEIRHAATSARQREEELWNAYQSLISELTTDPEAA